MNKSREDWYRQEASINGHEAAYRMDRGQEDAAWRWAREAGHFGNLVLDLQEQENKEDDARVDVKCAFRPTGSTAPSEWR